MLLTFRYVLCKNRWRQRSEGTIGAVRFRKAVATNVIRPLRHTVDTCPAAWSFIFTRGGYHLSTWCSASALLWRRVNHRRVGASSLERSLTVHGLWIRSKVAADQARRLPVTLWARCQPARNVVYSTLARMTRSLSGPSSSRLVACRPPYPLQPRPLISSRGGLTIALIDPREWEEAWMATAACRVIR